MGADESFWEGTARRAERRAGPRVPLSVPATLHWPGSALEGVIEDIGERGATFATPVLEPELPAGASVVLRIRPPHVIDDVGHPATVVRIEDLLANGVEHVAYALEFRDAIDLLELNAFRA